MRVRRGRAVLLVIALVAAVVQVSAIGPAAASDSSSTAEAGARPTADPASVDFGIVAINTTSAARTVTITNSGDAPLDVNGFSTTTPFGLGSTTCFGADIAPGASCTIDVAFAPTSGGTHSGLLRVFSNVDTLDVPLTGEGVVPPRLTLSATSLDFRELGIGKVSDAQRVEVTNSGEGELSVTGATAGGDFSVDRSECSAPLAAGRSCVLVVHFSPTQAGARTGTLDVATNGGDGSVALSGIGNAPPVLEVPGEQTVRFGQPLTFTVSATGPETNDALALSAADLPDGLVFEDLGRGQGRVSGTVSAAAGTYEATVRARDGFNDPVARTVRIVVEKAPTALSYVGESIVADGESMLLAARLTDAGGAAVAGRRLQLTAGADTSAQHCEAQTGADGVGRCSITLRQPLGPGRLAATFAGDDRYLDSETEAASIVYAHLTQGAFLIGDGNATVGATVTYEGGRWSDENTLSGGPAPPALKGFASTVSTAPPRAGATWSVSTLTEPVLPASVPSYLGVAVTSRATKERDTISGDVTRIAVVQTDAYAPLTSPSSTGKIVALVPLR